MAFGNRNVLVKQMQTSSLRDRRSITEGIFRDMQHGSTLATHQFRGLVRHVVAANRDRPEFEYEKTLVRTDSMEVFSANESADLIDNTRRIQSYLGAIARQPTPRTVVDAGCGSSALLALGAAISHPGAHVTAVEINPAAAMSAEEVIKLTGFADKIDVVTGNFLHMDLPRADLGITETFAAGLSSEQGPKILEHMNADRLLPRYASIFAADEISKDHEGWQHVSVLDFRDEISHVSGDIVARAEGIRPLAVWAAYYDEAHAPVISAYNADWITEHIVLRTLGESTRVGDRISFSYEPCTMYPSETAKVAVYGPDGSQR